MKKLFLFVIFLIFPLITRAAVESFVFVSDPQTVKPNEVSSQITIQAQDGGGNYFPVPQTACVEIASNPSGAEFSSNATNWNPVNVLTMNKNTANKNFYFKSATEGNYKITAKIALRPASVSTPCASWPTSEWGTTWTAEQNISVGFGGTAAGQQSAPSAPQVSAEAVDDKRITADAGSDKNIIAGAETSFSGKAFGLNGGLLSGPNVRYIWSFGDGSSKEGQSVLHTFRYLGDYIVSLDVSSGELYGSDRVIVRVVKNNLEIIEANTDYIKIKNGNEMDLEISGWFLRGSGITFSFPPSSFIKANTNLTISSEVTKIFINPGGIAELLFPNGSLAFKFNSTVVQQEKTYSQQPKIKEETFPAPQETSNQPEKFSNTSQGAIVKSLGQAPDVSKWFFVSLGLGLATGAGFFFVNRKGGA